MGYKMKLENKRGDSVFIVVEAKIDYTYDNGSIIPMQVIKDKYYPCRKYKDSWMVLVFDEGENKRYLLCETEEEFDNLFKILE